MARTPKVLEKFTVDIESLDQDGRGVAHRDGKVVFVEGALPGETVTYERFRNKNSYECGRAVSIEKESALRVNPPASTSDLSPVVAAAAPCSIWIPAPRLLLNSGFYLMRCGISER